MSGGDEITTNQITLVLGNKITWEKREECNKRNEQTTKAENFQRGKLNQ